MKSVSEFTIPQIIKTKVMWAYHVAALCVRVHDEHLKSEWEIVPT